MEKKVTKIDKNEKESIITMSYKIRFINSARFMTN